MNGVREVAIVSPAEAEAIRAIDIEPRAGEQSLAVPAPAPVNPPAPRTTVVAAPVQEPVKAEPLTIFASSPEVNQIFAALSKAQGEFLAIERTLEAKVTSRKGESSSYTYKYAPLNEVLDAVRPGLSANGLALMQFPFTRAASVAVRTLLGHSSGQWIYNELVAATLASDPQSVGSTITYLRRYGAQSLLGVAPGFDDDGAGIDATPAAAANGNGHGPIKPAARRSEQASAAAVQSPPVVAGPSKTGLITDVLRRDGAAVIRLSTGYTCATRDAELIAGAEKLRDQQRSVELITKAPSDPKYAPVLTEIQLVNGDRS